MFLSATSTARPLQWTESGASGAAWRIRRFSLIPTVRYPCRAASSHEHRRCDSPDARRRASPKHSRITSSLLANARRRRLLPTQVWSRQRLRPNLVLSLGGDHLDLHGIGHFYDVNGSRASQATPPASTLLFKRGCEAAPHERKSRRQNAGSLRWNCWTRVRLPEARGRSRCCIDSGARAG